MTSHWIVKWVPGNAASYVQAWRWTRLWMKKTIAFPGINNDTKFTTNPLVLHSVTVVHWSLFHQHGLTLIPAWISNHMVSEVRGEIAYPFLNFNGAIVEVCKISNFISHFIMDVITYTRGLKLNHIQHKCVDWLWTLFLMHDMICIHPAWSAKVTRPEMIPWLK